LAGLLPWHASVIFASLREVVVMETTILKSVFDNFEAMPFDLRDEMAILNGIHSDMATTEQCLQLAEIRIMEPIFDLFESDNEGIASAMLDDLRSEQFATNALRHGKGRKDCGGVHEA
jgi:hypothetical protein